MEIFLNKTKISNEDSIIEFKQIVRENRKYLDPGLIYQLLQSYGKIKEFTEFASIMNDYEKVILYYINNGEIDAALNQLTLFASYSDDEETLNILTQIFLDNCHIFSKKIQKNQSFFYNKDLKK